MNPAMMGGGGAGPRQVYVLNRGTKRESGRKAQLSNIKAGTVSMKYFIGNNYFKYLKKLCQMQ